MLTDSPPPCEQVLYDHAHSAPLGNLEILVPCVITVRCRLESRRPGPFSVC